MLTRVVSEFARVVVVTNNLKTCTSASLEAHVNAAMPQQNKGSGTRVADSSGAKDSIPFKGQNMMRPNTQSINGL